MRRFTLLRMLIALIALITLIALALALALAGCGPGGGKDRPSPTPLPGTGLDPPRKIADFTLTGQSGKPLKLSDLRGKAVLIFFGYTHCPDVCPTTLADFTRVKAALGADAQQVAFVFISVDGARDTPITTWSIIQRHRLSSGQRVSCGLCLLTAAIRQAWRSVSARFCGENNAKPCWPHPYPSPTELERGLACRVLSPSLAWPERGPGGEAKQAGPTRIIS